MDHWIYKDDLPYHYHYTFLTDIHVDREKECCCVCVCSAMSLFSLSLSLTAPIDYMLCSRHASITKRERRIRFLYVYSVMYVGKLVFSLFLIFLVICFRRWGLAKERERGREREKKSVDKKKGEWRKKKKKNLHICVYVDLVI